MAATALERLDDRHRRDRRLHTAWARLPLICAWPGRRRFPARSAGAGRSGRVRSIGRGRYSQPTIGPVEGSPGVSTTGSPVTRTVWIVFIGLMIGNALSSLDTTVVATALPTIVGDLHGLRDLSWLATSYLLTAMVSTPLYGKLGDLYGRKRIFLVALVLFLAGSILCGAAQSMNQLIVFRAIQGLGAGGLMSLPFAILGDLVPTTMLAKFIGYSSLVFLVASVGGPILGGVFAEHLSWRLVFYINVPLGLASLLHPQPVPARRPAPHRTQDRLRRRDAARRRDHVLRPDDELGRHPARVGLADDRPASASRRWCFGVAFVVRERRAAEPVIPGRMFRHIRGAASRRASTSPPVSRSGPRCTSPPRSCSTCGASIPGSPACTWRRSWSARSAATSSAAVASARPAATAPGRSPAVSPRSSAQ